MSGPSLRAYVCCVVVLSGVAKVRIAVPELGYLDAASFTVLPGKAANVVMTPADTLVAIGKHVTLHGESVDRAGNARPSDAVTYSVRYGGVTLAGRVVTTTAATNQYGFDIDWLPDGQWIVGRNAFTGRIDLINVTTSGIIPLTFTGLLGSSAWQPGSGPSGSAAVLRRGPSVGRAGARGVVTR